MRKNNNYGLLNALIIFVGLAVFIGIYWTYIFITDKRETEEKAEYNKCVRILINEDYIENGCDKYFVNDKWYKDFMKQMFDKYNKIK